MFLFGSSNDNKKEFQTRGMIDIYIIIDRT